MNKPQYKIGTLVTYANPAEHTGVIEGQIIRAAGNFYEIVNAQTIAETDIISAYRKVEKRVAKKRTPKTAKTRTPKAETATTQAVVQ